LIEIIIPASVEILCEEYFALCGSLLLVIFESGSKLLRIEKEAFREIGWIEIVIPGSVGSLRWFVLFFVQITFLCYIWIRVETAESRSRCICECTDLSNPAQITRLSPRPGYHIQSVFLR
jgi:hypothetical protein